MNVGSSSELNPSHTEFELKRVSLNYAHIDRAAENGKSPDSGCRIKHLSVLGGEPLKFIQLSCASIGSIRQKT